MHSTNRRKIEKPGKIRIIGGEYRGRRIPVASRPGLRPTPDRVRETLFNWLGQRLDGLACLDLFAGTGALGFEAASRGAAHVVMVERERQAFLSLEAFRNVIGASGVQVVLGDALEYLASAGETFDVVFLDPPFGQNSLPAVLERLPARLAPKARTYVEAERPVRDPAWRELRAARAGQVSYQLLERT